MNRKLIKFLLFIIDLLILEASLLIVLLVRYGSDELLHEWGRHYLFFTGLALIWLMAFYIAELYNFLQPLNYRRFLVCMAVNIGITVLFFYIAPQAPIAPKTNLALLVIVFSVLFSVWRELFSYLLDKLGVRRPVVLIGLDEHSLYIAKQIIENPRLGYTLEIFVVGEDHKLPEVEIPAWLKRSSVMLMSSMDELVDHLEDQRVHSIVVSESWYNDIYQELYKLFPKGIRFYQLATFWEQLEETIPVYTTNETWFLQNMSRGPNTVYMPFKRFFDLFFAVLLFPIILVLGLFTALMVKLSSPGPAIFKQTRVGLANQNFTIYKFRSMRQDAEKNGAQWATENDPRITKVGSFIRLVRLDELPQIINVFKGEMSFIGPRPERPEFEKELSQQIPHYNLRHLVKPGLNGWAQVKYRYGSSIEDAATKLMFDLYYVKNISPVLDMKIVLKTVLTILTKSGR